MGVHEPLHQPDFPRTKAHSGVHPDFLYFHELFVDERPELPADLHNRLLGVLPACLPDDMLVHRILPASLLGQYIDDPFGVKFLGPMKLPVQEHPFRPLHADPPLEQVVRPHPGEEVEHDLGEPELGLFLRDEDVARKGRLESTAEGVPLDEGDGGDGEVEAYRMRIEHVDAILRVPAKRFRVVFLQAANEKSEVASEVEHPGSRGRKDDVPDPPLLPLVLRRSLDLPLEAAQFVQHLEIEAGSWVRCEVAPEGAVLRLESRAEMPIRSRMGKER